MRTIVLIVTGAFVCIIGGCQQSSRPSPAEQARTLRREKSELTKRFESLQAKNERLQKQLQVLAGLESVGKSESIYSVEKIGIGKYTNFYDKDDDGEKEKLIVYIQPVDRYGDVIKAAGSVEVELWDLNRESDQARINQWQVGVEELKELWFAAIVTTNYRLTFEVDTEVARRKEPLTVKIAFTDYLTGKVFEEQRVIKP